MPLKQGLYRGFSSFEFQARKTFKLTDLELVKVDLLNHIFTLKGSRVMMPNFGTLIPELVFEQMDEHTIELVQDELRTVFDYDPRVQLLGDVVIQPNYDNNSLVAAATLFYIELNITDGFELNLQFEG